MQSEESSYLSTRPKAPRSGQKSYIFPWIQPGSVLDPVPHDVGHAALVQISLYRVSVLDLEQNCLAITGVFKALAASTQPSEPYSAWVDRGSPRTWDNQQF